MTGNDLQDPAVGWYERRNRFLDLHLYVQGLHSRVVRTPEMEARRANQLENKRRRDAKEREQQAQSHSPLGSKV